MESVIFDSPVLLIMLLIAAIMWLWSVKIKGKALAIAAYLLALLVLVLGALLGAGYNELIIISLLFALGGIITYNGNKEAEK
ncbi:MAG: hypothetical protein IKK58_00105 [Clostridia bacterium]|nr:hypothetical protein [Clostridia bacterium]